VAGVSRHDPKTTHVSTPPRQHKQAGRLHRKCLSLLVFYTLTVLVLRYAFDVELPNPLKDWRHYLGRIPAITVSGFDP
jgi:hypothetical protein